MNYCALDDAFQGLEGAPSPGCASDFSARAARKEERRRARKCKIPSASNYLQLDTSKDIDRQHLTTPREPEVLQSASQTQEEAFNEGNDWLHPPQVCMAGQSDVSFDKDPMHEYVKNEEREKVMTLPVNGDHVVNKRKFFGASGPDEDFFADYNPDQEDYRLQPDFTKAFDQSGLNRAGAVPVPVSTMLPPPNTRVNWKPAKAGGPTAFFSSLAPERGSYQRTTDRPSMPSSAEDPSMQEVMRRIDTLFARLDDLHESTPERMTSEMLMFISTGIFVMFMMDLLVKKGSTMRF